MKFKGRDVMEWLHEIRRKNKEEREKRQISGEEWLEEIAREAEKILGHKIRRIGKGKKSLSQI